MSEPRKGQVVTFYSYKGGTGRTMALANVAWILAAAGKRVLVADWDLEAPGLHKFFRPFLDIDTVADAKGVIDLIREYEDQVSRSTERSPGWVEDLARVDRFAFDIAWDFGNGGSLSLLSAGRQNGAYASSLSSLDWDTFYDRLGGAHFLDALREDMQAGYDYTLIDSRTGFSDVADICTQHLPDVLVDCFTLSDQGIDGAAQVARAVAPYTQLESPTRRIRVLPVAMRVDLAEKEKADAGRNLALRSFPGLPADLTEPERVAYFASVEVPYQAFYAYEETLAVFGDRPGSHTSLLAAYERLTKVITRSEIDALTPMDEHLRTRWKDRFQRRLRPEPSEIVLKYAVEDQIWAEWVGGALTASGAKVVDNGPLQQLIAGRPVSRTSATLAIVSDRYLAALKNAATDAERLGSVQFAVHLDDSRLPEPAPESTSMVGIHAEDTATERLLRLVGRVEPATHREGAWAARYPGAEPQWLKLPASNPLFTGRADDLQRLRRELRNDGRAVVLPVALQGMGGIGKTQLALEYAHRFANAYDLVWWIPADPPQFVDLLLSDLGAAMGLTEQGTHVDAAQTALDALRRGSVTRRWLLIFDNADDVAQVQEYFPQGGGGHLLITSRNPDWKERATPVEVDVFQRDESIAHLRSRVGALTAEEADHVAQVLGDLPIAIAAAGAWLAETGTSVDEYLREVEKHGSSTPAVQATTWDLSLERLRQRSPGAYRMLQICSVLASETSVEMLNSDQMAAALMPADPSVSERVMRGALVQQINRLALLKLDIRSRQVHVHRLLQEVVRQRMTEQEQDQARHEAHLVLAKFRPNGDADDPALWPTFRMIWPHLEVSGAVSCPDDSVRQLMIDRVRYLWRTGDLQRGLDFGESVAANWTHLLETSEDDRGTQALRRQLLHLRFNMANILREQAEYERALELDQDIHEEQISLLGEAHPHTLMTSSGLAADLRAIGRYADALPLEEKTYRTWQDGFGDDNQRTLMAGNNLAASLRAVGDFRRATAMDEEVAERRRNVLGPAHPYTLHSQVALGRDLREAGEYEQSVTVLRNVYALARQHHGPESLVTLNAQANLATSVRSAGRPAEAADLVEEAYDALIGRYGPTSPSTMACRLNRSVNLLAVGDIDRALAEMIAVTRDYQEDLGPKHPFSLVALSNESAAWRALGQPDQALLRAVQATEGCRAQLGENHPHTLAAAMNVATARFETGDAAAAVAELADIAERMKAALGQHHPDTLICLANLALLESGPRIDGAVRLMLAAPVTRAVDALSRRLTELHPAVKSLRAGRPLYRVIDPHDPY